LRTARRKATSALHAQRHGLSVNCVPATRPLCIAFALAFGMASFRAVADEPAQQAPLELTAANVNAVVDPLMAAWIGKHKGPSAVVIAVKRDGAVFATGYG